MALTTSTRSADDEERSVIARRSEAPKSGTRTLALSQRKEALGIGIGVAVLTAM